jgi:hypothetical protein
MQKKSLSLSFNNNINRWGNGLLLKVHPFYQAQNPFPFNYSAIPEAVKNILSRKLKITSSIVQLSLSPFLTSWMFDENNKEILFFTVIFCRQSSEMIYLLQWQEWMKFLRFSNNNNKIKIEIFFVNFIIFTSSQVSSYEVELELFFLISLMLSWVTKMNINNACLFSLHFLIFLCAFFSHHWTLC